MQFKIFINIFKTIDKWGAVTCPCVTRYTGCSKEYLRQRYKIFLNTIYLMNVYTGCPENSLNTHVSSIGCTHALAWSAKAKYSKKRKHISCMYVYCASQFIEIWFLKEKWNSYQVTNGNRNWGPHPVPRTPALGPHERRDSSQCPTTVEKGKENLEQGCAEWGENCDCRCSLL